MATEIAIIGTGEAGLHVLDAALARGMASRYVIVDPADGDSTPGFEAAIATRRAALLQLGEFELKRARHVARAASADLVVVALGDPALRHPGGARAGVTQMSRDREVRTREIAPTIERIIRSLFESASPPTAVLLLDDPVEVLTAVACHTASNMIDDPAAAAERTNRILGIGTVSATMRFQHLLARRMDVHRDEVSAMVVGEKDRMEIPLWSSAVVARTPAHLYCPKGKRPITVRDRVTTFEAVRDARQAVDAAGGTTCFADALAAVDVAQCILGDDHRVYTVSVWQGNRPDDAPFDESPRPRPCALAWPAVVGRSGIVRVIDELPVNANEEAALAECARSIRALVRSVIAR